MSKVVGLIGYPLGHSISAHFQQAAFDYLGLDIRYEAWEAGPDQVQAVVAGLRLPARLGANVTIPYKETVVPFLDELDELAQQIGAVNTIVNRGGRLVGYNTDVSAFLRALGKDGNFDPVGKQATILGAGGAARAASFGLVRAGVRALTIVNRTLERAETLAARLKPLLSDVVAISWENAGLKEALSASDLVVNCTSVGMKHSATEGESPLDVALIPKQALVYDVVYNPVETPLLRKAKQAGTRTLGGLAMLVYQGAAAFELWTEREAPLDIMFKAASETLRQ